MKYPITPPPELLKQWMHVHTTKYDLARQAAQWGADQELEACCEWFVREWTDVETADALRAARRPKPPSLKEQALEALDSCSCDEADSWKLIRRALKQLP